ncbi:DUF3592 domain-containing protein [Kitasatospora sp. NPDC002040]|uniref:DUF3592 domain-containing protein n=1 Tax=Kitasatospora sp. NPDC002040 TaxID=3154661 RepID=UPI0033326648
MSERESSADVAGGLPAEIVLPGSRGRSARFADGWVVIEQRHVVHRIPVAAIDRVVASSGRVDVLLRVRSGPAEVHRIRHLGSGAAFVRAVTGALPVRDEAERAGDGRALVQSAFVDRGSPGPARLVRLVNSPLKLFCWLYLAGFVLLAVSAPAGFRTVEALLLWLFGPPVLGIGAGLATAAVRSVPAPWALHRRGITVAATVTDHEHEVVPNGDDRPYDRWYPVYAFTDAEGVARTHTDRRREGRREGRAELCYDPENPALVRRSENFRAGVVWTLVGTLLVLVPIAAVGLGLAVGAVGAAFGSDG